MTNPVERIFEINDSPVRSWTKGEGAALALIAGYGGAPRWPAFAEILSKHFEVTLLSLPGQHGSERGHDKLFTPLDWIVATIELLERGVEAEKMHLVATSAAGMVAAEVAALAPHLLKSMCLVGPLGLYDAEDPPTNPYAQEPFNRAKFLMEDQDKYKAAFASDPGCNEADKLVYDIIHYRAEEAICRLMWPFGDFKLSRRLHRVQTETLLLWGGKDRCVPTSYAEKFAAQIPAPTQIRFIEGAGHLATHDAPVACAEAVMQFLAPLKAKAA